MNAHQLPINVIKKGWHKDAWRVSQRWQNGWGGVAKWIHYMIVAYPWRISFHTIPIIHDTLHASFRYWYKLFKHVMKGNENMMMVLCKLTHVARASKNIRLPHGGIKLSFLDTPAERCCCIGLAIEDNKTGLYDLGHAMSDKFKGTLSARSGEVIFDGMIPVGMAA